MNNINLNMELLGGALEIMVFGMTGIFLVSIILYLVSLALLKAFPNPKK